MSYSDFSNTNLECAEMNNAEIEFSFFNQTNLAKANMEHSWLMGSDFLTQY